MKLRRLCFYRHVSVHIGGGCLPQCMLGYHPPGSRHPSGSRPPRSRHPLGADPPPGAGNPLEQATPPGADTPRSRHPPEQTPFPLERRPLLRMVRILLKCILVQFIVIVFVNDYILGLFTGYSRFSYQR